MKTYLGAVLTSVIFLSSTMAYSQDDVKKGQEAYLTYGCAVCHGKDGRGDGLSAKTFDPPPTNFYDKKSYHYGSARGDVIYSIKHGAGHPGQGMPAFYHLTNKELEDIAAYVVSLQQAQ